MIHRRVFYSTSIETARRRYVSRRARVFRVFAETKHFPVADEPNRTEPNARTQFTRAKFTQDESAEKGGHHE